MNRLLIGAAALTALVAPAAAQDLPTGPSLSVCRAALVAGSRTGNTDLDGIVNTISTKLGFTSEQQQVQTAVCKVYYAGVADGIQLARSQREI